MGKDGKKNKSIFKQMKKMAKETATYVAPPDDCVVLDRCVKHQVTQYDRWVEAFENDGTPPTAEQAADLETEQMGEREAAYLAEAEQELKRGPKGDGDEMVQRKNTLRQQMEARRGRIFSKFSGEVAGLTDSAARILGLCVESLESTKAALTAKLPVSSEYLAGEFAAMRANLEELVGSGFPEGAAGLDNYDDGLPDGIPSYDDFKAAVDEAEGTLSAANEEATAAKLEEYKAGLAAGTMYNLKMAMKKVVEQTKAEIEGGGGLEFLGDDALAAFKAELGAIVDGAVEGWAPFPEEEEGDDSGEDGEDGDDGEEAPAVDVEVTAEE